MFFEISSPPITFNKNAMEGPTPYEVVQEKLSQAGRTDNVRTLRFANWLKDNGEKHHPELLDIGSFVSSDEEWERKKWLIMPGISKVN